MVLGDINEKDIELEEEATQENVPFERTLGYKFCTTTTCHGLSNVVEARRTWVRWFWGCTVLVAFGLLVQQVVVLSLQYAAYEAVTEFYVNRTNGLEFPAITICNYNRFRKDAIDEMSSSLDIRPAALWKYLSYSFGATFPPSTQDKLLVNEVHANLSRALGVVDVGALVDELSFSLDDFIPLSSCWWLGLKPGLCHAAMFQPLMTAFGKCWSFNFGKAYDPDLVQVLAGAGAALNFLVVLDQSQNSEQVTSGGNTQSGVRILVHPPSEYPNFETETIAVAPGLYGYISLEVSHDIRASPPWGTCGKKTLKYFPTYTQDACFTDSFIDFVKETCGCVPIYLRDAILQEDKICSPIDVFTCSDPAIKNYLQNAVAANVKCPLDCHVMNYQGRMSHAMNPNIFTTDVMAELIKSQSGDTADVIRNNILQLEIYFQRLKVKVMEQKPGKTFESLLADIGGQLGLFVGASVITVCEFIEYLIVKCAMVTKHRIRARRRRAASEAEVVSGGNNSSNNGGKGKKTLPNDSSNASSKVTFL